DFESILKEQAREEAIRPVSALAARGRTEEIRRSEVRATVHPVQLVEATVVMQRAEWQLESARGRRGTFSAQRSLSGAAAWAMTCPHCGRPPAALSSAGTTTAAVTPARTAAQSAPRTSAR